MSQASATTYAYDTAERLKEIFTTEGTEAQRVLYEYNPENGRVASVSNTVSGITTSYAYDIMDRATNITYRTDSGSLIRSLEYAYDAGTSMITNKSVDDGTSVKKSSYVYDSLDRVTDEDRFVGTTKVGDITYNYDLAGNRNSVVDNLNSITSSYAPVPGAAGGNRLQSWGANGYATYDDAGNTETLVSEDGTKNFDLVWDERYRLTEVEIMKDANHTKVEYGYDVQGRKVSRTAGVSPAPVEEEYYIYAGNHVIADADASGNLLRSYTYGPGIDNVLSMTVYGRDGSPQPSATYYYLKDHQNTVIALTEATGNVVESYEYDAYGNTKVFNASGMELTESAYGNRYTFQGREIDWDTGLMYFRARWYNPEIGHWLSKDPIGIAGGLNLYAYCSNNAVNYVDPLGLADVNYIVGGGGWGGVSSSSGGGGGGEALLVVIIAIEALTAGEAVTTPRPDDATQYSGNKGGNKPDPRVEEHKKMANELTGNQDANQNGNGMPPKSAGKLAAGVVCALCLLEQCACKNVDDEKKDSESEE